MNETMKQKETQEIRFRYVPLHQVSLEEVTSRDPKSHEAYVFLQRLKAGAKKVTEGVWMSTQVPSFTEELPENIKIVKPEDLEEQVKAYAPRSGSRMMTLEEALLTLEWIRQEENANRKEGEKIEIEQLASSQGIQSSIFPYMTNRKKALLVKTEGGYAILGADEGYLVKLPCTDVRVISGGEYIDGNIKPIMVLKVS